MKKRVLILGIICAAIFSLQAQTPSWDKFTSNAIQNAVVTPLNNGGYITAYDSTYVGSVFPGQAIKKVNGDGSIAWTHLFKRGSYILSSVKVNGVSDDGNGGAIVVGQFKDVVYFGGDSLKAVATFKTAIFIARINAAGKVWWMKAGGLDANYVGDDDANFVETKNNAIYVSGALRSRDCSFGSVNFPKATYGDVEKVFLAKINLDGAIQWVKLTKGGPVYLKNMAVDAGGNASIVGFMTNSGTVLFDNSTTVESQDQGIFVVKYSDAGTIGFVKSWCYYDGGAMVRDIDIDGQGNMYIIGYSGNWGSSFKGFVLPEKTSYLLKLNADGTIAWWRFLRAEMGASVLTGPQGVVVSGTNVFVMGNYSPSGYLQSNATDSVKIDTRVGLSVVSEVYIASYAFDGNLNWHETGRHDGIISNNQATGLFSSPDKSNIIINGTFTTEAKFAGLTLPSVGTLGSYVFGFITISTGVATPIGLSKINSHIDVKVYPNPTTANIFVTFKEDTKAEIKITDIQGRILLHTAQNNVQVVMNVESLKTGVYIITIETEQGIFTQKFIKN